MLLTYWASTPSWRGCCEVDIVSVELSVADRGSRQCSLGVLTSNDLDLNCKVTSHLRKGRGQTRGKDEKGGTHVGVVNPKCKRVTMKGYGQSEESFFVREQGEMSVWWEERKGAQGEESTLYESGRTKSLRQVLHDTSYPH